jgi:hypothetical protein
MTLMGRADAGWGRTDRAVWIARDALLTGESGVPGAWRAKLSDRKALTVRHPDCGHSFEVEGEAALPLSARPTEDPSTYEVSEVPDCPRCTPPEKMPDR